MRKALGILLSLLAILLYALGLAGLYRDVLHNSVEELIYTLKNIELLIMFLATAAGALAPGSILHFFGYRLLFPAKPKDQEDKKTNSEYFQSRAHQGRFHLFVVALALLFAFLINEVLQREASDRPSTTDLNHDFNESGQLINVKPPDSQIPPTSRKGTPALLRYYWFGRVD
jgi:hypothetical protein